MQASEIAKEIIIKMIDHNAFTFNRAASSNDLMTPVQNAQAVAAAYETLYSKLVETINKDR